MTPRSSNNVTDNTRSASCCEVSHHAVTLAGPQVWTRLRRRMVGGSGSRCARYGRVTGQACCFETGVMASCSMPERKAASRRRKYTEPGKGDSGARSAEASWSIRNAGRAALRACTVTGVAGFRRAASRGRMAATRTRRSTTETSRRIAGTTEGRTRATEERGSELVNYAVETGVDAIASVSASIISARVGTTAGRLAIVWWCRRS